MEVRLPAGIARPDNHVEAFAEAIEQLLDQRWIVLAVGIHEHDDLARLSLTAPIEPFRDRHKGASG